MLMIGKREIAFVEFETMAHSTKAKIVLNQFEIAKDRFIDVKFANKWSVDSLSFRKCAIRTKETVEAFLFDSSRA